MANERPTLNICNTTSNSSVKNVLCEGNVNVTDDGTLGAVNIGDTVEDVIAENVTFRGNHAFSNVGNMNMEPAAQQSNNSTRKRKANSAACSVNVSGTNRDMKAKKIINNTTVNVNASTQPIPDTIFFQVEEPEDNFTGRSRELRQLKQFFAENAKAVAICGMGGVGKTQLARAFISQNRSKYKVVIWIHSDEAKSIEQSFCNLCKCELRLSTEDANGREMEPRYVIPRVLGTLCEAETLFVYDNVDSAASTDYVKKILAMASTADAEKPHVLITSRHQEWPPQIKMFPLKVWNETQSVEYITKILNDCPNDSEEDKISLAKTLQHFPLALRQATAYIRVQRKRDPSFKISQFIEKFSRKTRKLLNDMSFKEQMMSVYEKTTYTTWRITMDEIQKDQSYGTLAIRILKIIAFCDVICIPVNVFHCVSNDGSQLIDEDEEDWKERVDSAVDLLVNYCMVDRLFEENELGVHRLVQEVIKLLLTESNEVEAALRDALQLITNFVVLGFFSSDDICSHVESIFDSLFSSSAKENLMRDFSLLPATILREMVTYQNYDSIDISFLNKIFNQMTNILGPGHRHVLKFGYYWAMMEPFDELEDVQLNKFLDIYEMQRVHLPEADSDTLATQCSIAYFHIQWGHYDEAANWLKQMCSRSDVSKDAIAIIDKYRGRTPEFYGYYHLNHILFNIKKKMVGEDLCDAISIVHDIAASHNEGGNYELSFTWYKESFEILSRDKQRDKSRILDRFLRITNSFGNRNYTALRLKQFILNEQKNLFGKNHDVTLNTLFDLAEKHSDLGNYNAAVQLCELQELNQSLKYVNRFHSVALYKISDAYIQLKNYDAALKWYSIATDEEMEDTQKRLKQFRMMEYIYMKRDNNIDVKLKNFIERRIAKGESHPETIQTMCEMARTYIDLNNITDGSHWYRKALHIQTICLGEAHRATLNIMCQIARICEFRSTDKVLDQYRNVFDKMIKSAPSPEETCWDVIIDEADFHFHEKSYILALNLYEILLEKQKRLLRADDARTLHTQSMLTKRSKDALKVLERKLDDQRNSGEYHGHITKTMCEIAGTYSFLQQYDLALQGYQDVLNSQRASDEWEDYEIRETFFKLIRTHVRMKNNDEAVNMWQTELEVATEKNGSRTWPKFHAEASFQFDDGNYEVALQFHELILEKQMFWLGADHSETLKTLNEIARTKSKLQKYEEALTTFRDVFEGRKIYIGEFHPDTLRTMNYLAHLNKELGNSIDAQKLYRQLYATLRYLKGNEHPETRSAFEQCDLGQQETYENYLPDSLKEELAIRRLYTSKSH